MANLFDHLNGHEDVSTTLVYIKADNRLKNEAINKLAPKVINEKNLPDWSKDTSLRADGKKPETYTFLGFTHYYSKSRNGKFRVKRKTSRKKFGKKCKEVHR